MKDIPPRPVVFIIIAVLFVLAVAVSLYQKPIEPELLIDEHSPGVWPKYAAANRVEMSDQFACMRLVVPYAITSERPKGVTRT